MPRFIYDIIPPGVRRGVAVASREVSKWIKVLRVFLKTSKYGTVLLIIVLVGFGTFLVFAFQPKTETVEIFPTQYRVETWSEEMTSESQEFNWRNGEKALQKALDKEATLAEFSSENSAILFEEIEKSPLDTEDLTGQVSSESDPEGSLPHPPGFQPGTDEERSYGARDLGEEEIIEETPLDTEDLTGQSEVAGTATESEEVVEEQIISPHLPEIEEIPEESDQAEPQKELPTESRGPSTQGVGAEPIPEGVGGCEFCEEETPLDTEDLTGQELASDAEDLLNLLEEIEEEASISQPPLTSYSIIFSGFDFNSSISFSSFKKAKLAFSFAAGAGNEKDVLLVEYKIIKEAAPQPSDEGAGQEEQVATNSESIIEKTQSDSMAIEELIDEEMAIESESQESLQSPEDIEAGKWKTLKLVKLDKEQSNSINDGYWQREISDIASWEDLDNLEVRITFQGIESENRLPVYLDAIWLEVEYEPEKKTTEEIKELTEDDVELELISGQRSFKFDEKPEFEFKYKRKRNIVGVLTDIFQDEYKDIKINAKLFDPNGRELRDFSVNVEYRKDGEFLVDLPKQFIRQFRPGKYTLKIEIEDNGQIFIQEQDFTWGVLAINTNKSIYLSAEALAKADLPPEQAYLQMAVLDDKGNTICDAKLEARIWNLESRIETVLSTENGGIQYSGECGPDNVTDKPDYFAYYQVDDPGIYEMKLINLDNGYEITDSFEVQNYVPFEIERIGPTRVYPPVSYQMKLKIKVNQDFIGEIIEYIPSSFEIKSSIPNSRFQILDSKQIIWQVDWKAGETYELEYQFDAPDISPYLYLLGPLQLRSGQAIFEEARQWQIAADSPGVEVDAVSTTGGCTYGSSVTIEHTTGSGENRLMLIGVAIDSNTVSPVSATYNGVAMTLEGWTGGGDWQNVAIYSLVDPDAGTHNAVITLSGSGGLSAAVMTFTGVDQITPLGTYNDNASGNSVTVSSAPGELVFDTAFGWSALTAGANQTQRWNFSCQDHYHGGSTKAGATSVTMTWTNGAAIAAIPIKPVTPTAWLSGWEGGKRVKITIDSGDIDADLTDFPVLVYISTSSGYNNEDVSFVFDELQSDDNRKKIAVTKGDGTTQLYVEIEKWDDANEEAWLWVKVPRIISAADTELYLYYDSTHADNTTYVGDVGSRTEVWDSNYQAVWHMNELNALDSTSNNVDGTAGGSPGLVTGKIGNAVEFYAVDEYIDTAGTELGLTGKDELTFEVWFVRHTAGEWHDYVFVRGPYANPIRTSSAGSTSMRQYFKMTGTGGYFDTTCCAESDTAWYYYTARVNVGDGDDFWIYENAVEKGSGVLSGTFNMDDPGLTLSIGDGVERGGSWDGLIDEIRVSNIDRGVAWVTASYETQIDELLDWGSEELGNNAPNDPTLDEDPTFGNIATASLRPDFAYFNATDPDNDNLEYLFEIDNNYDFGSVVTTAYSYNYGDGDTGWTAATFSSGTSVSYTLESDDQLSDGTTYWWRVRTRDPTGSNTWSTNYSDVASASITIDISLTKNAWLQTVGEQFDTGILSNIATTSTGAKLEGW